MIYQRVHGLFVNKFSEGPYIKLFFRTECPCRSKKSNTFPFLLQSQTTFFNKCIYGNSYFFPDANFRLKSSPMIPVL
jgi:hypothetical protein